MEKLEITKGEWSVGKNDITDKDYDGFKSRSGQIDIDAPTWKGLIRVYRHEVCDSDTEAEANAKLIADAGTTYNQCGDLPSDLLKAKNELLKILEEGIDIRSSSFILDEWQRKAKQLIQSHKV